MRQLLLRVGDTLHAELVAVAKDAGRSVNSLANELLELGVTPTIRDRRQRLQSRLAAIGTLGRGRPEAGHGAADQATAALRRRAISSMRGAGAVIDEALAAERGGR